MFNILILASAISIALLYLQLYYTRSWKGLEHVPGPFIASFSNAWKVWAVYQENMPGCTKEAHRKYGPVVRIGPNTVSFSSAKAVQTIHSSREAFIKVTIFYPFQFQFFADRTVRLLCALKPDSSWSADHALVLHPGCGLPHFA